MASGVNKAAFSGVFEEMHKLVPSKITNKELEQLKKKTEETYRKRKRECLEECYYEGLGQAIELIARKDPKKLIPLVHRTTDAKVQAAALNAALKAYTKKYCIGDISDKSKEKESLYLIIDHAIATQQLDEAHSILQEGDVVDDRDLAKFHKKIVDKFIEIGGVDYSIDDVVYDAIHSTSSNDSFRKLAQFLAKKGRLKEFSDVDEDVEVERYLAPIAADLVGFIHAEDDLPYLVKIAHASDSPFKALEQIAMLFIESPKKDWAMVFVDALKTIGADENDLAKAFVRICGQFMDYNHTYHILNIAKDIKSLKQKALDEDKNVIISGIISDLKSKGHTGVANKVQKLIF